MHDLHQQVFEAEAILQHQNLLHRRGVVCRRLEREGNPKLHQKWAFIEPQRSVFILGEKMEFLFDSEDDAFKWLLNHTFYWEGNRVQVVEVTELPEVFQ